MPEREPTDEELQDAIDKMSTYLQRPAQPSEVRLVQWLDQKGAEIRDMSDEERRQLAKHISETSDLSVEDALDWVNRMSGQEDS